MRAGRISWKLMMVPALERISSALVNSILQGEDDTQVEVTPVHMFEACQCLMTMECVPKECLLAQGEDFTGAQIIAEEPDCTTQRQQEARAFCFKLFILPTHRCCTRDGLVI